MAKHNRRESYWCYYEMAKECDRPHMVNTITQLITKNPCPRKKGSNRGRPLIHSKEKLDFACLLMMADNDTFRNVESNMKIIRTKWDKEPVPDHTTLVRHMQTIPIKWMEMILAETARLCLKEAGGATGSLGADSSGVETTRYTYDQKSDKKKSNTAGEASKIDPDCGDQKPDTKQDQTRRKVYQKYHITVILGLQIILAAIATPGNIHDTNMLPIMLYKIQSYGFKFKNYFFNADRGYDSDQNFMFLFMFGMIPNIKQRKDAKNKETPHRKEAAKVFDQEEYTTRSHVEGIFGAEETRNHQLRCRFILEANRKRFALGRAISWNIRVLNRFECANRLGVPLPSYGKVPHAECPR